jgi:hypothetical protein
MEDEYFFKISSVKTKKDLIAIKGSKKNIDEFIDKLNKEIENIDLLIYYRIGPKRFYEINKNCLYQQLTKYSK